jgi:hypothetical protein
MPKVHFPDPHRVDLIERLWRVPVAGELRLALAEAGRAERRRRGPWPRRRWRAAVPR